VDEPHARRRRKLAIDDLVVRIVIEPPLQIPGAGLAAENDADRVRAREPREDDRRPDAADETGGAPASPTG